MVKGVAVILTLAGALLLVERPLTKTELDTARVRLQVTIEAVDKKVDRLNQQVQILNEKIDKLNRGVTALEKNLIGDGKGEKTTESANALILSDPNNQTK